MSPKTYISVFNVKEQYLKTSGITYSVMMAIKILYTRSQDKNDMVYCLILDKSIVMLSNV